MVANSTDLRECLRPPIPDLWDAARYLDAAVSAHLAGNARLASELLTFANMPAVRDWTESLWGKNSPYLLYREVPSTTPLLARDQRPAARMPSTAVKAQLHRRDGFHCRFCGLHVIRREVRILIQKQYPEAVPWGDSNDTQHAAFQAMWAQYDHLVPHSRGGESDLANMVITCAPCNFGRMQFTLDEVGLLNPLDREPVHSLWDGLERINELRPIL